MSELFQRQFDIGDKRNCPGCGNEYIIEKNHLRWRCSDCSKERLRQYRKNNKRVAKNARLKTTYNITIEQYEELLEKQNFGCAICTFPDNGNYSLAVDHDHFCCPGIKSCGKCVRALLCMGCNTGMGRIEKQIDNNRQLLDFRPTHVILLEQVNKYFADRPSTY